MPQLKVQNLYNTTITEAGGIPSSGDCNFTVATPPTNSNGFIIISPENAISREIMYYHDVVGNRIYVRAENRFSPKAHAVTDSVKMNDVAEIFNTFSDMISQAFYIEKTGGLNVKVWGGYVYYNGLPISVPDTMLTLADNQTNYIKYDYATNTSSVDTVDSGNIKAQVVTLTGAITSIGYRTAKESYIDFTVDITGALPPQAGNAGKVLVTNATTVSWGTAGLRDGFGIDKHVRVNRTTGSEEAKTVSTGTAIISTDIIRVEKASGDYEDISASILFDAIKTGAPSIAGEDLLASDIVTEEFLPPVFLVTNEVATGATTGASLRHEKLALGNIAAHTRRSVKVIGNGVSSSSLQLAVNKVGTPTDNLTIRIETDTAGNPSGTLAHANAVANVAGGSIGAGMGSVTFTFGGAFTLTSGTVYHIVLSRSTAVDAVNYYNIGYYRVSNRGFLNNSYNTSWGTASGTPTSGSVVARIAMDYAGCQKMVAVKASASTFASGLNATGIQGAKSIGEVAIMIKGDNPYSGITGLSKNTGYYLSNTAGTVSTSKGAVGYFIGNTNHEGILIANTQNRGCPNGYPLLTYTYLGGGGVTTTFMCTGYCTLSYSRTGGSGNTYLGVYKNGTSLGAGSSGSQEMVPGDIFEIIESWGVSPTWVIAVNGATPFLILP